MPCDVGGSAERSSLNFADLGGASWGLFGPASSGLHPELLNPRPVSLSPDRRLLGAGQGLGQFHAAAPYNPLAPSGNLLYPGMTISGRFCASGSFREYIVAIAEFCGAFQIRMSLAFVRLVSDST